MRVLFLLATLLVCCQPEKTWSRLTVPHECDRAFADVSFDLVAQARWGTAGLRDALAPRPRGEALGTEPILRWVPELVLGPDDTPWITAASQSSRPYAWRGWVGRWRDGQLRRVPLDGAGIDELVALAPTLGRSLIVLGRTTKNNILARIAETGEVLWRRSGAIDASRANLAALQGGPRGLALAPEGAVYLFGRIDGTIARIDLETGRSPVVLDLGSSVGDIWVRGGHLHHVVFRGGARYWSRTSIEGRTTTEVRGEERLYGPLGWARGPIPGGGAVLVDAEQRALLWMNPRGRTTARLDLAGVVRRGSDLVVAVRESNRLCVGTWSGGVLRETRQIAEGSRSGILVSASSADLHLWTEHQDGCGSLARLSQHGVRLSQVDLCKHKDALATKHGLVDVNGAAVATDGSIRMAGADPAGPWIVALRRGGRGE